MTSHRKRVRVWPEIWNHLKTTDQKLEVKLRSKSARFMYTKSLTHYIQLSTFTTFNDFFFIFMHNSESRKSRNPIKMSVDDSQNTRYRKWPLFKMIVVEMTVLLKWLLFLRLWATVILDIPKWPLIDKISNSGHFGNFKQKCPIIFDTE